MTVKKKKKFSPVSAFFSGCSKTIIKKLFNSDILQINTIKTNFNVYDCIFFFVNASENRAICHVCTKFEKKKSRNPRFR